MVIPAAAATASSLWWGFRHASSRPVLGWNPSRLTGRRVGDLYVRRGGHGQRVSVLLHGLVASGDIFGAAFDRLSDDGVLLAPDLLGFGRSLDESRVTFTVDDHLDALDAMLTELECDDRPIVIGAHSMGTALALGWAERRGAQVERIVCWGAPVYDDAGAVADAIAHSSPMARLFVADTRVAAAACHLSCSHREIAGWIAAACAPELPVAIARGASLHTWAAYRDAVQRVVAATDWPRLVELVSSAGGHVEFVWGESDHIGDRQLAERITGRRPTIVHAADHHLPMSDGALCASQLDG